MKNALILSGGGMKGAIQLGMALELIDAGIEFDAVSGISVGALNAAVLAAKDIELLKTLWLSVKDSEGGVIFGNNYGTIKEGKLGIDAGKLFNTLKKGIGVFDLFKGVNGLGKELGNNLDKIDGLLTNDPLYALLTKEIKLDKVKIPHLFGSTSLETGKPTKWSNAMFYDDDNYIKAILASSNMPGILKPIETIRSRRGTVKFSVDGGIRTISPTGMIFDLMEPEEDWTFYIGNCNSRDLPFETKDSWSLINSAGRAIDIMLNQIFINDIDMMMFMNANADYLNMNPLRTKKVKTAKIVLMEPNSGDGGNTLDATPKMIDYRIELGRSLAKQAIK